MAIKKYVAKVTGTHAFTGKFIEEGKEYDIEESLAGSEAFEETGLRDLGLGTGKDQTLNPNPQSLTPRKKEEK